METPVLKKYLISGHFKNGSSATISFYVKGKTFNNCFVWHQVHNGSSPKYQYLNIHKARAAFFMLAIYKLYANS